MSRSSMLSRSRLPDRIRAVLIFTAAFMSKYCYCFDRCTSACFTSHRISYNTIVVTHCCPLQHSSPLHTNIPLAFSAGRPTAQHQIRTLHVNNNKSLTGQRAPISQPPRNDSIAGRPGPGGGRRPQDLAQDGGEEGLGPRRGMERNNRNR